jgi:hypothetical protein
MKTIGILALFGLALLLGACSKEDVTNVCDKPLEGLYVYINSDGGYGSVVEVVMTSDSEIEFSRLGSSFKQTFAQENGVWTSPLSSGDYYTLRWTSCNLGLS